MLARVHSSALLGIEGLPLAVEVDNYPGSNGFVMVGLPDAAVKESKERVGSALKNSGYRFPRGNVVVNLAPADLRKEGSALDLPIALGLLAASEQIEGLRFNDYALAGELALDGSIRPVTGSLSRAICARDQGIRGVLVPAENADEAGVVSGVEVIPVSTVNEAAAFLSGVRDIETHRVDVRTLFAASRNHAPDLNEVKGQAHVKRALTVAAAGGHNLLTLYAV
jgi:magnesium chelatase family protein